MVKRSPWGTLVALALVSGVGVAGCNPKSSVVIDPNAKTDDGKVVTQTTTGSGSEAGSTTGTPDSSTTGTTPTVSTTPTDPSTTAPTTQPPTDTPVTSTPATGGSTPVTLRFAFTKGEQMKYTSTTESSSTMSGTDAKMPAMKPMSTNSSTAVKVLDNASGKAKIELMVASMDVKGGITDAKAQEQIQKMSKGLEGLKVTALFDAMGNPSGQQYAKGDRMQAMSAGIDSTTGFLGITYPEKAVNLGDSWTHKVDYKSAFGSMGQMASAKWSNSEVLTKFTLKSIDATAGTAVISIETNGTPSFSINMGSVAKGADKSAKMPSELKMSFKVKGGGTAIIDLKTGLPKEISVEATTEFSNPMGGGTMTKKDKSVMKRQ